MSIIPGLRVLNIDHITVAGAHLDALRQALLEATGIRAEYGGPHSNQATEMALASFPDGSYLELIAIRPGADPLALSMHPWSRFLSRNGGPCAFALRASDFGSGIRTPEAGGRTRPDGVKLAWETAHVGMGGLLFPFLIRDLTPRADRVFPNGKPATDAFSGVAKIVIGVSDLDLAIAQYHGAFHLDAPLRERNAAFDAELAWFEGTPIVLGQGLSTDSWLARRVHEFGDAPCAFVLQASRNVTGIPSKWFGHPVFWADAAKLGWRFGVEPVP